MMKKIKYLFLLLIFSCNSPKEKDELMEYKNNCPISSGFDFPVGKPMAKGYYNAQKFTDNNHLGEDWNGNGGGDTDLGDPVYSTSEGIVFFAADLKGGWGNVIRILHNFGTDENPFWIESIYAHLDKINVNINQKVDRGEKIGTIGTAHGKYKAHLHFEMRDKVGMKLGGGYSKITDGFLNPTDFILGNRKHVP